jgi:hypothetical protein
MEGREAGGHSPGSIGRRSGGGPEDGDAFESNGGAGRELRVHRRDPVCLLCAWLQLTMDAIPFSCSVSIPTMCNKAQLFMLHLALFVLLYVRDEAVSSSEFVNSNY